MDGKGTQQSPFLIRSREDFDAFCQDQTKWMAGVHTRLETDIDLSDTEFDNSLVAPYHPDDGLGSGEAFQYNGVFDGNSRKMIGLRMRLPEGACPGIFYAVGEMGVVRNLQIAETDIQGTGLNSVAVSLCFYNHGLIENCRWTGTISGSGNSVASGGLVYTNKVTGRIVYCFAGSDGNSKIFGRNSGGICYLNEGEIERSGAAVEIRGPSSGGLVSINRGALRECYSAGLIIDSPFIGGLCSQNSGEIENCFSRTELRNTGKLNASNPYIGGLVGYMREPNSSGEKGIGFQIKNSLACGKIQSSQIKPGGLVGKSEDPGGVVESSFWNTETTGPVGSEVGTGISTAQMNTQSVFEKAGWDFKTVWRMGSTGPELRNAPALPK